MTLSSHKASRIRKANSKPENPRGEYILYWMQAYRRLEYNHSLDVAFAKAKELGKPLLIYEGLRKDYPWNSKRIHKFILEGILDNWETAESQGISYRAFVETDQNSARGVLKQLSEKATLVVTDDFPCFIIPEQIQKLADKLSCSLLAVDGNGLIPLHKYGSFASAARVVRTRMHSLFLEAYENLPFGKRTPKTWKEVSGNIQLPNESIFWKPDIKNKAKSIESLLSQISFQNKVEPDTDTLGGRNQALNLLETFVSSKLKDYGEKRSNPNPPSISPSSGLSPYLHFGMISQEEIVQAVLDSIQKKKNSWNGKNLNSSFKGKRENYFCDVETINSFLDELITWRDTGFQLFWQKPEFRKSLDILPNWTKENFQKHAKDKRPYNYTKEELRDSKTHDPIWNACQKELVKTGRMHNYMRMLWGKKIIEWTNSYQEAFDILEDFNNLYAYDGRNPNSYTGILWCFGLFDRPWFPERPVLGNVRYMSSDSTRKKFKIQNYMDYVDSLGSEENQLFGKRK